MTRRQVHFLENLRRTGNVRTSSELAGRTRRTFYRLRRDDSEFRREWHQIELEVKSARGRR